MNLELIMNSKFTINEYSKHVKELFAHRIQKITIDAGLTFTNRDGRISYGTPTVIIKN